MYEILCLEKFEGDDIKYHSTVAFSSYCTKIQVLAEKDPNKVFAGQSSSYLHEALYELKFTSLKTNLLPNISRLCCYNRIFRFLY